MTANLTISASTASKPKLSLSANGASLSWSSVAGAVYRVSYKNILTDPTWTSVGADITANGALTMWMDPGAATARQRFYLISRVQ